MGETNGDPTADRLAELERENARLRAELRSMRTWHDVDHLMLDAFALREIPLTSEELNRVMDSGMSLSDLIAEVESDTSLGSGK
jgi:hypothetical protein